MIRQEVKFYLWLLEITFKDLVNFLTKVELSDVRVCILIDHFCVSESLLGIRGFVAIFDLFNFIKILSRLFILSYLVSCSFLRSLPLVLLLIFKHLRIISHAHILDGQEAILSSHKP